ncbi:MAG TPA: MBL fold metallo-hydrolase [Candidatus Nitrosocosmicus sp.]
MSNMEIPKIRVRINGTLPDTSTLGNVETSERAAEIKNQNIISNTSCSVFLDETNQIFHILVDVGQGIIQSIEKNNSNIGLTSSSSSITYMPDALLITHAHIDHIKELPLLIERTINNSKKLQIFCTLECYNNILKTFPQLLSHSNTNNYVSFNMVKPNITFNINKFSITPILANHGEDYSVIGSVIYIINVINKKIIMGWDFLSLPDVDENVLWNPDLLILGTQSYNPHPETGMISVTDAFPLIRRWNAKECYLVHYRGLLDLEEAKNQWFRGPTKPMTTDELQRTIDPIVPKSGGADDAFRIIVAKEGMTWNSEIKKEEKSIQQNTNFPIGNELLIESLQTYVLKFEKDNRDNKLKLMIEDRINRFDLSFDKPIKEKNRDDILYAQGEKGMLSKGPNFRMQVIDNESSSIASINAFKGSKSVFREDIPIKKIDGQKLRKYIAENF